MADIDMNSEFLRFFGGLRFQIYGLWRILNIKKYKGRLSYSKTSKDIPSLDKQITDRQNYTIEQKTYLHQIMTFIPWISETYQISPLLELHDEAMDMQKIPQQSGRLQLAKYLINCESGQHFDRENKKISKGYNFQWDKIKSFRLEPNGDELGVFGIDGERYQAQKIQAKLSDGKILTFA